MNAHIHAQKITVIAGANTIPVKAPVQPDGKDSKTDLGEPHLLAADPANRPAFALDLAELGCIYANKVWLIGTEVGLGIHTAKRSEFKVTHAGEIVHHGEIKTEGNANISAAEDITVDSDARIAAQGKLSIHSQRDSWLNMAEIELNVMIAQCLNRRIDNIDTVRSQVATWQNARDQINAKINWQFTTDNARIKFKRLYPTFES